MRLTTRSEDDQSLSLRVKVEINTHETAPAEPIITRAFNVASSWFVGQAPVRTFTETELMATKIRALYQRKKGRDLFDMWLGLTQLGLTGGQMFTAFAPYRPDDLTAARAIANLQDKLSDDTFRGDLAPLVGVFPDSYDIDEAGELIINEVLVRL